MPDRASEVLKFIKAYKARRGMAPTYREIGAACGMSSTAIVRYWLDRLVQDGKIKRYFGVPRGIVVLDNESLAESA